MQSTIGLPPTKKDIKTQSRKTPWTENKNPTSPLQSFIDRCTERDYAHRHLTFEEMNESEFINSYKRKTCRMYGSDKTAKTGNQAAKSPGSNATPAGNASPPSLTPSSTAIRYLFPNGSGSCFTYSGTAVSA